MLQALNSDGELVTLYNLSADRLSKLKEEGRFYCPDCKEELIIRAGEKVIAHFAHRKKSTCQHGGEGIYHEKGKLDLYLWLRKQGIPVKLEFYLAEIKQRPDLLVEIGTKTLAIEYQCAEISIIDMKKRTESYLSAGIVPLWILGGNKLKRLSSRVLKLTANDASYIHQFHQHFPLSIYYYCSTQKQFIFFQDFSFLSQTKAFGNLLILSIEKCILKDFFTLRKLPTYHLLQTWRHELQKWRNRPVPVHQKKETAWRQWLYLQGLNVQTLPYFVNLPIQCGFMLKTPPWVWQSRLYLELIVKQRKFSFRNAMDILNTQLYPASHFPLIHSTLHPIKEYFQQLERIGILKSNKQNIYVVIRLTV
ncbi:competence protein CoiA [Gracilibacillus xinjiangensis]|uniref:Competence protein CoiA n=1 Tax=Gracilibacillus xinjiangensis TaxID=1193282 RepID=A0ABV8WZ19_9BACI